MEITWQPSWYLSLSVHTSQCTRLLSQITGQRSLPLFTLWHVSVAREWENQFRQSFPSDMSSLYSVHSDKSEWLDIESLFRQRILLWLSLNLSLSNRAEKGAQKQAISKWLWVITRERKERKERVESLRKSTLTIVRKARRLLTNWKAVVPKKKTEKRRKYYSFSALHCIHQMPQMIHLPNERWIDKYIVLWRPTSAIRIYSG